jgi:hypothetical protein
MGLGQTIGFELAHMGAPLDPAPHQSCFLQRLDVLRGRREGHAERARKPADTALCERQAVQHRPPGRIGESVNTASSRSA